jgi:hypothetical protein
MSISILCPDCTARLTVSDEDAGHIAEQAPIKALLK